MSRGEDQQTYSSVSSSAAWYHTDPVNEITAPGVCLSPKLTACRLGQLSSLAQVDTHYTYNAPFYHSSASYIYISRIEKGLQAWRYSKNRCHILCESYIVVYLLYSCKNTKQTTCPTPDPSPGQPKLVGLPPG